MAFEESIVYLIGTGAAAEDSLLAVSMMAGLDFRVDFLACCAMWSDR